MVSLRLVVFNDSILRISKPEMLMRLFQILLFASTLLNVWALDCGMKDAGMFGSWEDEVEFSSEISFGIQWKILGDELLLGLSANHTGYLGFGIGEPTSGSMIGADILTVSVNNEGKAIADDRFVPWAAFPFANSGYTWYNESGEVSINTFPSLFPVLDSSNQWELISGEEIDGCIRVVVKRPLVSCDENDRDIVLGQMSRILWAFGDDDSVAYHSGNRGITAIDFSSSSEIITPSCEDGDSSCHIVALKVNNFELNPQGTNLACKSFRTADLIPDSDTKYHITGIVPMIDAVKYVHHIIIQSKFVFPNSGLYRYILIFR